MPKILGITPESGISTINEHIKNVYKEGELEDKATIRKFRIVQNEGSRKVIMQKDEYNMSKLIRVDLTVSRIVPKWSQGNFARFNKSKNKVFLSSIK